MALRDQPVHVAPGAGFLVEPVANHRVFTPEDFTDEQRMIFKTATDFSEKDVLPKVDDIEHKKNNVMVELMRKAGDLGLLMNDVPEAYGGMGGDRTTSMLITEAVSQVGSFSTTYGAHTGIGTLPIVYFGTPELKARYLPKLASGEWMGAYALTESGAGSDALSGRTSAKLSEDGKHYILNGVKQWITNAAWAKVFTVFAKIDGQQFTAFVVDRDTKGLSIGPEHKKMGIRGSSTCDVILEDVMVPATNILGEIGKGHKVALNVLNVGRYKLGAGTFGGSKLVMELAIRYAKERQQFNQPISNFGMIRRKISEMAMEIYACESMCYRLGGLMDGRIALIDKKNLGEKAYDEAVVKVIEEYTVEASILKIFGSELADFSADETLQIYGGYGYTEEYPIERIARDARITRIFEGTNEINRLLITGTILKRALTGRLDLFGHYGQICADLDAKAEMNLGLSESPILDFERRSLELAKRGVIYAMGTVGTALGQEIERHQQILAHLADSVTDLYAMGSVIGRTFQTVEAHGMELSRIQVSMCRLFTSRLAERCLGRARAVLVNIAQDETEAQMYVDKLRRFSSYRLINAAKIRDQIAVHFLEKERYAF